MGGGLLSFTDPASSFGITLRGNGTLTQTGGTIQMNGGAMTVARTGGLGTYLMNGGTVSLATGSTFTGVNNASGLAYFKLDGGYISTPFVNLSSAGSDNVHHQLRNDRCIIG